MKSKPLNIGRHRITRWCVAIAAGLGLNSWALGQAIYEEHFNRQSGTELREGAGLGANASGVSGHLGDKSYSSDTASSPNASALAPPVVDPTSTDAITITAWYRPRTGMTGATTLFNAFGTHLLWDDQHNQWVWRIWAKPVNPDTRMYWFYSGRSPLAGWNNPGEWTFIAMVWRRSEKRATFYQGDKASQVLEARDMTRNEDVEPLEVAGRKPNVIGNDTRSSGRTFNGEIDNIRFIPKALDQDAIETIRQADLKNEALKLP